MWKLWSKGMRLGGADGWDDFEGSNDKGGGACVMSMSSKKQTEKTVLVNVQQ